MADGQEGRLESLQERLEKVAAVKATMAATRNKNSSKSPVEIKEMAAAAKFRNPVLRKDQRKKRRRPEDNLLGGCDSQGQDYFEARQEKTLDQWEGQ